MELRQLRAFLAIADTGDISGAAKALHVTQPALSRTLKELEDDVGGPLLVRSKRPGGGRLTGRGLLLHKRAKEISRLLDETRDELIACADSPIGPDVEIAIGCVETTASLLMAKVVGTILRREPGVRFALYGAYGDDLRERLDRDELELAFLLEPIEAAKYRFIRLPIEERLGLMVRADDPLAGRPWVGPEDVVGMPLVLPSRGIMVNHFLRWLGRPLKSLRLAATTNLMTNSSLLVLDSLARQVIVEGALTIRPGPDLAFVPFRPALTSGHVLAWSKTRPLSAPANLFLSVLRAEIGSPGTPAKPPAQEEGSKTPKARRVKNPLNN